MISVILCGGAGSRLWPLSRAHFPKQFIDLDADLSLLQKTIKRTADSTQASYFITNEEHRFLVAEQTRQIGHVGRILLEPEGRNTAPALAACALQAVADGYGDEVMVALPADHQINCEHSFSQALKAAEVFAQQGYMVTLGIEPEEPHTGYGYIQQGQQVNSAGEASWVECFVEKPNLSTAEAYIASGQFLWNSGVYAVTPRRYLERLQTYAPDIVENTRAALQQGRDEYDFKWLDQASFTRNPSISIDHALMEPLCRSDSEPRQAIVIPVNCGWSDLGSWGALYETAKKDEQGNVSVGDVLKHQVSNSYIHAQSRLVSVVGVDDLIVVESVDAVLVADRANTEAVKAIVEQLKQQQRPEYYQHRQVLRPWGQYDLISDEQGYRVKKISVKVGASLSLQKHRHRAEHWVVVKGCAEVVRGDERLQMTANESTFIPIGEVHSLKNIGATELVIIEVQSGDYLGEDDIVRYQDRYGRV